MGMPAARVGDSTAHLFSPLTPGPGALLVDIGSQPAWRCNFDTMTCPIPIAPPAPAPHAAEKCFLGSLSVMIGGAMAVRVGDQLIGAGGPNSVVRGQANVLIGDIGFGLANPANMDEFCKDMAALFQKWSGPPPMTQQQREQALSDAINKQLAKSGVPTQSVVGSSALTPGNAQYWNGVLEVSQQELNAASLTSQEAAQLANRVYHEGRHAEQWFLMAQQRAAQNMPVSQISAGTGVTPNMATAAAANPLPAGPSPQQNLASACQQSVYGPNTPGNQFNNAAYRNNVLNNNHTPDGYRKYLALVEEQDAWATGNGLPCGQP